MSEDKTKILTLFKDKNGRRSEWTFRDRYNFQIEIQAFHRDKKKNLIHVGVNPTSTVGRYEVIPESE